MAVATGRDEAETREALGAWLVRMTGSSPVDVGPLTIPGLSGFSNETILFDASWPGSDAAVPLVLRVEPSGHQVFPSTEFDAQARVMRALHAQGSVPVPEVRWFEEDRSILGDRFMVMPRIDGQVPADNPSYHADGWMAELPEDRQAALWMDGIDTMGAIHRIDRAGADLLWIEPRSPLELLDADRAYREFACGNRVMPALDRAFDLLAKTAPPADAAPALCWGDSRIGNMIFDSSQRVAAVLDWEMVTAGDPVQDLAWYLLLDRHHHEGFGVPRLAGLPDREASVARWEEASGRAATHLGWYELLGGVRYAAIMVRVMELLDAAGVFPGASETAHDNTGTQLLERLLEEWS